MPATLLQGVLNSSVNAVMALEAVRDDDGRIIDFTWTVLNQAAEGIFGVCAEALIGRRMLEHMPETAHNGLFERYVGLIETGEGATFEHRRLIGDEERWFNVSASPFDGGFVVSFHDVTAAKAAAHEARRADPRAAPRRGAVPRADRRRA